MFRAGFVSWGGDGWYSLLVRSHPSGVRRWVEARAARLAVVACALCVLGGAVVIWALSGLDETPRWWAGVDTLSAGDPAVIDRAERIENAITTQLTALRDPEDPRWAAAITPEQANAWLAVRLRETIETHLGEGAMPRGVERVRVSVDGDRLLVGARVLHSSGAAVVWTRVGFELDEAGELWVRLGGVRVGRTRLPAWAMGLAAGDGALRRSRYRLGPGALELGDGREARLIALRINDGRLELIMETSALRHQ